MNFKQGEELAKYTSFKIGGKARLFLNAKTEEEIIEAIQICLEQRTQYFILGGGSNLLISDKGFDGLVIKMSLNKVDWLENGLAEAQSGFSLSAFAMLAGSRGLGGMEVATTIPGTVGGAIRGNAGAYGWETKDSVVSIKAIDDALTLINLENKECRFSYRDSVFKHKSLIVVSGVFQFNRVDKNEALLKAKSYQDKKNSTQPLEHPNTGCIFKNVLISEIDNELLARSEIDISEFRDLGKIPAGFLIDKLGLKGKQIGHASVSEKHGNFIINLGGATSDHVIQLISYIKHQARDRLGIELKEEIQYVGFK